MFNKGIAVAKANFTVNFLQPLNTDRWKWTPDTQLNRPKVCETDDTCLFGTNTFVQSVQTFIAASYGCYDCKMDSN